MAAYRDVGRPRVDALLSRRFGGLAPELSLALPPRLGNPWRRAALAPRSLVRPTDHVAGTSRSHHPKHAPARPSLPVLASSDAKRRKAPRSFGLAAVARERLLQRMITTR